MFFFLKLEIVIMLEAFKRAFQKNERQMKALTGLSSSEFSALSETFEKVYHANRQKISSTRKRAVGGGKKSSLSLMEKLFVVLFYLKTYPTFDVLGACFKVDRSTGCRWIHQFLPILEPTLGEETVLPERQIESLDKFRETFPELEDIFIDGTERPTQRASDYKLQKEYYSGKKKRQTLKNLIFSDSCHKILRLSQTQPGKNHDYTLFKQLDPKIPSNMVNWVDLGFQGIEKDFPSLEVVIPKKKPRGKELTFEQKGENTMGARVRVAAEHAIAGIKRLKIVSETFRNRTSSLTDTFMLLACGLWNFHLKIHSG